MAPCSALCRTFSNSQGCAAFPPRMRCWASRLSIAANDSHLRLALHVDYGDYIAGRDVFAHAGIHISAQHACGHAAGSTVVIRRR